MRARTSAAIVAIATLALAWVPMTAGTAGAAAAQPPVPTRGDRSGLYRHHFTSASARAANANAEECTPKVVTKSVTLKRDQRCGLDVQAENVTIDLGGHTVRNVVFGGCPMVLRNGTVSGTIFSCGASTYVDLVVRDGDSPDSPGLVAGFRDVVRHNKFFYNDVAIDTFYGGEVLITDNLFRKNRLGVWSNDSGERVIGNTFALNTTGMSAFDEDGCIGCGGNHTIKNNRFARNNIGVSLGAFTGGQGNVVDGNTFDHNRTAGVRMLMTCVTDDGAVACGGQGSVVTRNLFTWNGHQSTQKMVNDGFSGLSYVDGKLGGRGLAGVTLSKNVAKHNFDLGIQAPKATDGGANRASYNGDERQCAGVRCKPA